jgi:hypothetical protein
LRRYLNDGLQPLKVFGVGKCPYSSSYRPEIGVSYDLDDAGIHKYQEWITNTLQCAIKSGRIDIITEVSCLSQYMCQPRIGHLDVVHQIFRYCLQKNLSQNPGRLAFDPAIPMI